MICRLQITTVRIAVVFHCMRFPVLHLERHIGETARRILFLVILVFRDTHLAGDRANLRIVQKFRPERWPQQFAWIARIHRDCHTKRQTRARGNFVFWMYRIEYGGTAGHIEMYLRNVGRLNVMLSDQYKCGIQRCGQWSDRRVKLCQHTTQNFPLFKLAAGIDAFSQQSSIVFISNHRQPATGNITHTLGAARGHFCRQQPARAGLPADEPFNAFAFFICTDHR